jgi:hypothetical protein
MKEITTSSRIQEVSDRKPYLGKRVFHRSPFIYPELVDGLFTCPERLSKSLLYQVKAFVIMCVKLCKKMEFLFLLMWYFFTHMPGHEFPNNGANYLKVY